MLIRLSFFPFYLPLFRWFGISSQRSRHNPRKNLSFLPIRLEQYSRQTSALKFQILSFRTSEKKKSNTYSLKKQNPFVTSVFGQTRSAVPYRTNLRGESQKTFLRGLDLSKIPIANNFHLAIYLLLVNGILNIQKTTMVANIPRTNRWSIFQPGWGFLDPFGN